MAYVPHMLRDQLLTRGGAMLVVAAVFIAPLMLALPQSDQMTAEQMRSQSIQVMLSLSAFMTLIATYGLIGQDFRLGFYRPMFAKPVSVPLYYALLFCCAAVSFWLVQTLTLLGLAAFGINAWAPAAALEIMLRFTLLGTIIFAISRVTRLDWILALLFFTLASPLRQAYPAEESIRGWLINVFFPPTHLFDLAPAERASGQLSALITSAGPEWGSIAWLVGYGTIWFLIGLWLVRRIQLAAMQ